MGSTNSNLSQCKNGADSGIDNGREVLSDNVSSDGDKLLRKTWTIGTALAEGFKGQKGIELGPVLRPRGAIP